MKVKDNVTRTEKRNREDGRAIELPCDERLPLPLLPVVVGNVLDPLPATTCTNNKCLRRLKRDLRLGELQ